MLLEFIATFDSMSDVTAAINLVVSLVAALGAIACMQVIARQEWRHPLQVHLQRFCLALLSICLLVHAFGPYTWGYHTVSMLAVIVSLMALLLVTALFHPQRPNGTPRGGVGGPRR